MSEASAKAEEGGSRLEPYITEPLSYWQVPQSVDSMPPLHITVLVCGEPATGSADQWERLHGLHSVTPGIEEIQRDRAIFVSELPVSRQELISIQSLRGARVSNGIVTNWSETRPGRPYATVGISLVCLALLTLYFVASPMLQQAIINLGGMQPRTVSALILLPAGNWWNYPAVTVFSAIFLHASWLHLAGNLAYLWVFGISVEQRLGTAGMVALFLTGGALANIIVALQLGSLEAPIIGASGAISAVVEPLGRSVASIGLFLPLGLYSSLCRSPPCRLSARGSRCSCFTRFSAPQCSSCLRTHLRVLPGSALHFCTVRSCS
jgi:membrane associated rhomboid family serine protease